MKLCIRGIPLAIALACVAPSAHADEAPMDRAATDRAATDRAASDRAASDHAATERSLGSTAPGPEQKQRCIISLSDPTDAQVRERVRGVTLVGAPDAQLALTPSERPAGTVLFSVEDADLSGDVLPLFEQQVGVRISYVGPARTVSLRLTQPLDWEHALDLVCRFTGTHLARDYKGELELRSRFGGKLPRQAETEFDDLDGQLVEPDYVESLRAAHEQRAAAMKGTIKPPTQRMIQIGNPRPMRMGPNGRSTTNQGPARTGPGRVGPARPFVAAPPRIVPQGPARVGTARPFVATPQQVPSQTARNQGPANQGSRGFQNSRGNSARPTPSPSQQARNPQPVF